MKFLVIGLKSDDRTIVKNALSRISGLEFDMQYSGSFTEALFKIRSFLPEIVLVDENAIDSNSLTQLKNVRPEALIYVIVSAQNDMRACELIRRGAFDLLLREEMGTDTFVSQMARAVERIRVCGQFQNSDLSKARTRLFYVVNTLPTMCWLSDETGDRILFNDKWLKFTGRESEQELGKKWGEALHPQDSKKFWSAYNKAVRERKPYHIEYRLKTSDGQFHLLFESGNPQFRDDGSFVGMVGSCADMSEAPIEHAAIGLEPPLGTSTTLDHVPIGVWKLDLNLVITKANPAVAVLFDVPPERLVGRAFSEVVSTIPETAFAPVLENGERIKLENHPVTLALDEERRKVFLDLAAWPLKDKANNLVGVCVSTTEVTQRLLADQQRDDFVASLVHDLKTPLIGADQALESMMKGNLGPVDPAQSDLLSMLKRSNGNLLSMVQNLIEAYRYDAGETRMSVEEFSLYELINSIVEEMQGLARHKEVTMRTNHGSGTAKMVGDRLSIRRVLLNLLDNSLKFTPRNGLIEVSADESDENVAFRVSDTGSGIASSEYNQVFLRYWQGDSAKLTTPGTGLGLYLCRQIVTSHGGTISVASKLHEGTTFSVVLPKQPLTNYANV